MPGRKANKINIYSSIQNREISLLQEMNKLIEIQIRNILFSHEWSTLYAILKIHQQNLMIKNNVSVAIEIEGEMS